MVIRIFSALWFIDGLFLQIQGNRVLSWMDSDIQYSRKHGNINYVYQFYMLNFKLLPSVYPASSFQGNAIASLVPGIGWDWA